MIEYYATSVLHLSLEVYHNAGIPPSRSKELIESIWDMVGSLNLWCEPSGLNDNWNVHTRSNTKRNQETLICVIGVVLDAELKRMKQNVA